MLETVYVDDKLTYVTYDMLNTIITVTILLQYYCWLIITYGDVVELGMDHTVWCWDVGYQQLVSDFNV